MNSRIEPSLAARIRTLPQSKALRIKVAALHASRMKERIRGSPGPRIVTRSLPIRSTALWEKRWSWSPRSRRPLKQPRFWWAKVWMSSLGRAARNPKSESDTYKNLSTRVWCRGLGVVWTHSLGNRLAYMCHTEDYMCHTEDSCEPCGSGKWSWK